MQVIKQLMSLVEDKSNGANTFARPILLQKLILIRIRFYFRLSVHWLIFFILLDHFCVRAEVPSEYLQTNLLGMYGFKPENLGTVSMEEVRATLEQPPNITDAIFSEWNNVKIKKGAAQASSSPTNFYRSAWATNGYLLANALNEADLIELSPLNETMGRFGVTNWHASGYAVVYEDSVTDKQPILGKERSALAQAPLRLGILPLVVGSVKFLDATNFEAQDLLGKKLRGSLIPKGQNLCSGIQYESERAPGWEYIVTFLARSQPADINGDLSGLAGWISCSIGHQKTTLMTMMRITRLDLATESIPENHFQPQFWLSKTSSIPVVSAYAFSNQLMIRAKGQLVSVGTLNKFIVTVNHPQWRSYILSSLIILILLPLIAGIIYWFKKSSVTQKKTNKTHP